jgi:hypothetical protein
MCCKLENIFPFLFCFNICKVHEIITNHTIVVTSGHCYLLFNFNCTTGSKSLRIVACNGIMMMTVLGPVKKFLYGCPFISLLVIQFLFL